MSHKVTWKKGMRLSTNVFDAMDSAHESIAKVLAQMASAGRYGLIPSTKPFELSVNIGNNILEVVSLNCRGITKSGKIVDIAFDSNYTNTFDARVPIHSDNGEESFLLIVKMLENQWREIDELYSEASYVFELIGENSPIDNDSLPIGRIINQYGWRLDVADFIPPCLYVKSHYKYEELAARCRDVAKAIFDKCLSAPNCVAKKLIASIWSGASQAMCITDKERGTLTPGRLYSAVQQLVNSFLIGCTVDEYINLENKEPFVLYSQMPFDEKNLYRDIEHGLSLCGEIEIKMDAVCAMSEIKQEPAEAPIRPQKPQPTEDPKAAARKRWEGIEI